MQAYWTSRAGSWPGYFVLAHRLRHHLRGDTFCWAEASLILLNIARRFHAGAVTEVFFTTWVYRFSPSWW